VNRDPQIQQRLAATLTHLERLAARAGIALGANNRALRAARGRHRGRAAFIVGNGPSLRVADLARLDGRLSMGSNKIYLAFEQTAWRPDYLFMEDRNVINQTASCLDRLDGVQLMMPHTVRLAYPRTLYYHYVWLKVPPPVRPDFGLDPMVAFYWGFTVTFTMLQWAFYCGVREVYLLGIDFNYPIASPDKVVRQGLTQYYASQGEATHFHKDYYPPGTQWMVPDLEYQRKAFESARDHYAAHGAAIFNATRGGRLDVFPRADLDEVLERNPPVGR